MKTQILFVTIFLVWGAISESADVPKSDVQPPEPEKSHLIVPEPPKLQQKVEPVPEKPSTNSGTGVSGDSTNISKEKTTTPKTVTNVDVLNNHSDVSDLIGDSMFTRAAYLLTGISVLILLYFAWKSFSLRRRQTHIHKYGVVASREDLEMTSLGFGSEDEEDDTTHFDIGKHQRS